MGSDATRPVLSVLNQKPIFLHCFGRGGSDLLLNLVLSHPNVCSSGGETHRVFKRVKQVPGRPGRGDSALFGFKKHWLHRKPIQFIAGQDVFSRSSLTPREPLPALVGRYVDYLLYQSRFTARAMRFDRNRWRYEGVEYTRAQLAACRMVTKSVNGLVFTTEMFRKIYPDAVFFAMVRNGLAICEGRGRRGSSVEKSAEVFNRVAGEMLACSERLPNYHLVHYEDMVNDPARVLREIYARAGLEVPDVPKVRFEATATIGSDGVHRVQKGDERQGLWYAIDDMHEHMQPGINENQIARLEPADRDLFMSLAGDTMKRLGYGEPSA